MAIQGSLPRCELLGIVKLAGQHRHPAFESSQHGMHLLPVSLSGLLHLQNSKHSVITATNAA